MSSKKGSIDQSDNESDSDFDFEISDFEKDISFSQNKRLREIDDFEKRMTELKSKRGKTSPMDSSSSSVSQTSFHHSPTNQTIHYVKKADPILTTTITLRSEGQLSEDIFYSDDLPSYASDDEEDEVIFLDNSEESFECTSDRRYVMNTNERIMLLLLKQVKFIYV